MLGVFGMFLPSKLGFRRGSDGTDTTAVVTEEVTMDWEPMRLNYLGHAADVLRQGGGKLSTTGGDPGEPRKPKGCETDCPPG
jgi:hypothetical protein